MKIEKQALEDRQVELKVEVPHERLEGAMRAAARRLSQQTKIPGFRPGKAPYQIILSKFGKEAVFEEALETLGQEVYRHALDESEIDPFAPGADFGGMMSGRDIWIDEAYHKTFIAVDEKGTEAAAATAVVLVERGGAENVFAADRPFLFLIRERETGLILFLGRVSDPSA